MHNYVSKQKTTGKKTSVYFCRWTVNQIFNRLPGSEQVLNHYISQHVSCFWQSQIARGWKKYPSKCLSVSMKRRKQPKNNLYTIYYKCVV